MSITLRAQISAILTIFSFAWSGLTGATEPRFEDFPAEQVQVSPIANPILKDLKSRQYATALREQAKKPLNFSGHYVLAEIGCGASCVMSAAIDAKSGKVIWLPFTVCCSDVVEPIEYKLDSRLIKVRGSRNEAGSGVYFYVFDGNEFLLTWEEENR